jgi:aryl-alcohol dehydrogenase-like predicted oxidoreductase
MDYQIFGRRTGLRVSELALGTGNFGTGWGYGAEPEDARKIEYSLADRTADREILPMAEGLGLGVALWSPLGGGFLTGKYRNGEGGRRAGLKRLVHWESSDQKTAILDEVLAIAREIGATPSQVAVAWLRHRATASTTALVPIIGPRTVAQLDDYLGSLETSLTDEQAARLTAVSAVPLGVPHEAVAGVRDRLAGGDPSRPSGPPSPAAETNDRSLSTEEIVNVRIVDLTGQTTPTGAYCRARLKAGGPTGT